MTSCFFGNTYFLEGNPYNCNPNWVAMGAFFGFGIMTIFMSRRFLWKVTRHILGRPTDLSDAAELLPYRLSVLFIFGGLGLFYWSLLRFELCAWLALVVTLLTALILIAAARVVLETGLLFFRTPISLADAMLYALRNTLAHTWTCIPGVAAGHVYLGEIKNFTAQAFGHVNKLAGSLPGAGRSRRALGLGVTVAVVLSMLVCLLSQLSMSYGLGVNVMHGTWHNRELPRGALEQGARTLKAGNLPAIRVAEGETPSSVVRSSEFQERAKDGFSIPGLDQRRGFFLLGGFLGVLLLSALRVLVVWWPLHPIGLLLCNCDPIAHAFFSIFLAWLVKAITFRVASTGGLRRVSPFFAGLLAGCALGILLSWLISLSNGLYACYSQQNWSWQIFMHSPWIRLVSW